MLTQSNTVTPQVENANYHHLVMDMAWFAVALAATSRFLSIYAIHVGASALQLGLINSLPALILLISASFGTWWRRRHTTSVKALWLPGLGMRFIFLLPAFAPFMPPHLQPWWLVLSVCLPAIPQGVAGVTFLTMMREAVMELRFASLLNRRSMAFNAALAVGALAFGLWLETAPYPLNYQVMFMLAFVFALGSLYHCLRVRVATPPVIQTVTASANPWHAPAFRQVALVAAVLHISFTSILAITPLHLGQTLKATEGFMALFGLIELSAGAAVAFITPHLIARFGIRGMMALSMVGTSVAAVIFAMAHSLPITLIGAALSGACWTAAAMVGLNAYFNKHAPSDQMTPYSVAYQQIVGFSAFIGPLIGSALASSTVPLAAVLMVGAALRLAAGIITEHHVFARCLHRPARPRVTVEP